MGVTPGTRVGPYEFGELLGAGGMGEVYRARDTQLDRDVAIKILPASRVGDSDRVARFEREAKALAALNNPHIAQLYGLEDASALASGSRALVMELVPGVTLAQRLAHGPLPLAECLRVARQIADALEAAHEKGIVHRDLKPANIRMRPDGEVKVLDFGIAKALGDDRAQALPETAATLTAPGVMLGTPAYMSPEQVRGAAVTHQSDVWAFGVIIFELLTGRRPFDGPTTSDTLAAVLGATPDWSALPPETPDTLRRLVRRCLERDLKSRLRDIGDARLELDDALDSPVDDPKSVGRPLHGKMAPRRQGRRLAFIAGSLVALAAMAFAIYLFANRQQAVPAAEVRLQMPPPAGTRFVGVPAISPDGLQLVFSAVPLRGGSSQLWLRRLAAAEPTALAGTEGASYPFWSSDSRSVAFFADQSLKRVGIAGGAPIVLTAAPVGRGGLWLDDDTIVFAPSQFSPLMRVKAAGGQPTPFTKLSEDESGHRFAQRLPGRQLLYFSTNKTPDKSGTRLISLDDPDRTISFFPGASVAEYANGYLLAAQNPGPSRRLIARRISLPGGQLLGDPVDVGSIRSSETFGRTVMSAAANGVVAFWPQAEASGQFTWISRDGRVLGTIGSAEVQLGVELSPNGQELATYRAGDTWIVNLERPVANRVTRGDNRHPIWSADGSQVITTYQGRGLGTFDLDVTSIGTGRTRTVLESTLNVKPLGVTPENETLVFGRSVDKSLARDIVAMRIADPNTITPFLRDGAQNLEARLSADGKWIAYSTDRSGRFEVEVQSFPVPGRRHVVSLAGGGQPRWRSDGKEVYFLSADAHLMAVPFTPGNPPVLSAPVRLFEVSLVAHPDRANFAAYEYDVSHDGSRFLVNRQISPPETNMTIIVNWSPRKEL
jgi:eukaryotic-like serine/threonine-protein kinase